MTAPVLIGYCTAPMHAVLVIKAEPTPPDLKKDCLVNQDTICFCMLLEIAPVISLCTIITKLKTVSKAAIINVSDLKV